jgi:transposase
MSNKSSSDGRRVRVKRPERRQIEWQPWSLDQLLPADHRARVVWRYVESLDLSAFYEIIEAVEGGAGRDAVDPQILLALWMFATIEGISSARHLDRLCERDLAYLWICGGVGVNYHLLSDFRTAHGERLEGLLTDTIATLMHQGLVTLNRVAQDGMRVRASAGSSSFRRQPTLEKYRQEAAEQVRRLREERDDDDPNAGNARCEAARQRAAREREERVEQAIAELEQLCVQKESRKKGSGEKARASTTDPEARVMKMANGGFRPAYNVQYATDGDTRLIVAVDVTNSGSDRGQMAEMQEDVAHRYGKAPDHYLVDCGFATKDDITEVERNGSAVLAPIHGEESIRRQGGDPHTRRRGDSDEMFAFRQRMAEEEARTLYKQRPSIAEFPNAECRNHGLYQFRVRGLRKVKATALLQALVFNLFRLWNLKFVT